MFVGNIEKGAMMVIIAPFWLGHAKLYSRGLVFFVFRFHPNPS